MFHGVNWLAQTMEFWKRKIQRCRKFSGKARPNPRCSEFEVNNEALSKFILRKLIPVVGVQPYPLNELMLMTAAVLRFRPDNIFEWGTNIGISARIFWETITYFGIPTQIHSIDLPDQHNHSEHPHQKRGMLVQNCPGVSLYQGDGIATAMKLLHEKKHGAILFFLDGDHSYETVKRELEAILSHFKKCPVLLHDTFFQSPESGYNVGPNKALQEVLATHQDLKTISTLTGLPGMTLIYR